MLEGGGTAITSLPCALRKLSARPVPGCVHREGKSLASLGVWSGDQHIQSHI